MTIAKTGFIDNENIPSAIESTHETSDNVEYADTTFSNDENILKINYASIPIINEQIKIHFKRSQDLNESVKVCIVIPTYNEAHNILKLLKLVYSKERQLKYDERNIMMNVLVVDDNSPDGTADIVKAYQKTNPNIYLLQRSEKNGLGAAYIAGMQHAMKLLKPGIIFEMDGDLSHGPEYIMPMIAKIREGADLVIGSRYIKGGSLPEKWGIKRMLISKSANLYAKTVLRIKEVNDCTGGFRAIRTSALEKIDFGSLKTKGYAFQISLLEEMRKNNVIMREVPIAFKDRTSGVSKMSMRDMVEEGFFVLKTSLENMFYPKKRPEKQDKESKPIDKDIKHQLTGQQLEFIQAYGLEKDQLESIQAYGFGEIPFEVGTISA